MQRPEDDSPDALPPGEPDDEAVAAEAARIERAAAFLAAHDEQPLTPPLLIAGLLALAWWALLGWQAVRWWPQPGPELQVAAGVSRLERGGDGDVSALLVGDGAGALRFECGRRRGLQLQVLAVPLVECADAEYVFAVAQGHNVHVRYDRPDAGGRVFLRLLALTADGEPLWSFDDSIQAFGWHGLRAGFLALVLLIPGWWLHRIWLRAAENS